MPPWAVFFLKSVSVFVGAVGVTDVVRRATGQISLFDWLAMLWPAVAALAAYWGGVADSTPAPWKGPRVGLD